MSLDPAALAFERVVRFEGRHAVLDGVRGVVPAGAVTGLLGPNGSGKSTLLRVLGGLVRPQSGVVALDGQDVYRLPPRSLARLRALMEQQSRPEVAIRVRDVVMLGRVPHQRGGAPSVRDRAVVESALRQVGLDRWGDRWWSTLSGGERQRVHLARAFAQEPALLLLDEPTNHLDVGQQVQLMRFLSTSGVTTLVATHDIQLAALFCDHVLVLSRGEVVASGPPRHTLDEELLRRVFGVSCLVHQHPTTGRPVLTVLPWGPPDDARPVAGRRSASEGAAGPTMSGRAPARPNQRTAERTG
ncbi:MAG TPA: ABC transporter ATP-binding protein [Actinomycetales bacterium]|nr:ABC transporter ATP-binding protein [Actinomycetales bacterium]